MAVIHITCCACPDDCDPFLSVCASACFNMNPPFAVTVTDSSAQEVGSCTLEPKYGCCGFPVIPHADYTVTITATPPWTPAQVVVPVTVDCDPVQIDVPFDAAMVEVGTSWCGDTNPDPPPEVSVTGGGINETCTGGCGVVVPAGSAVSVLVTNNDPQFGPASRTFDFTAGTNCAYHPVSATFSSSPLAIQPRCPHSTFGAFVPWDPLVHWFPVTVKNADDEEIGQCWVIAPLVFEPDEKNCSVQVPGGEDYTVIVERPNGDWEPPSVTFTGTADELCSLIVLEPEFIWDGMYPVDVFVGGWCGCGGDTFDVEVSDGTSTATATLTRPWAESVGIGVTVDDSEVVRVWLPKPAAFPATISARITSSSRPIYDFDGPVSVTVQSMDCGPATDPRFPGQPRVILLTPNAHLKPDWECCNDPVGDGSISSTRAWPRTIYANDAFGSTALKFYDINLPDICPAWWGKTTVQDGEAVTYIQCTLPNGATITTLSKTGGSVTVYYLAYRVVNPDGNWAIAVERSIHIGQEQCFADPYVPEPYRPHADFDPPQNQPSNPNFANPNIVYSIQLPGVPGSGSTPFTGGCGDDPFDYTVTISGNDSSIYVAPYFNGTIHLTS